VVTTPGSTKSTLWAQTPGPLTLVLCPAVVSPLPTLSKSVRSKGNNTNDEDIHNSNHDENDSSGSDSSHDDWHLCQHRPYGCDDSLM